MKLLLLLCLFSSSFAANSADYFPTFRSVVIENATVGYNKKDSPSAVFHKNMTVQLSSPFLVLTKVSEVQQLVSYIVNFIYRWKDERLVFDSNVIGSTYVYVPSNQLWIPTIDCFNCNSLSRMDRETDSNEAEVWADGTVSILMKARIDAVCDNFGKIESFPFDTHFCGLNFISKNDKIKLEVAEQNIPEVMLGTPEWQFNLTTSTRMDASDYNIVAFRFILKRRPNFYVTLIILPTVIVSSIVIATLTLPLELSKAGRFQMGLSGLLSMTFLLGILLNQLPRSQEMSILGKWFLMEEFFVVFVVLVEWPLIWIKNRFILEKIDDNNEDDKENNEKKVEKLTEEEKKQIKNKNRRRGLIFDILKFVVIFGANTLATILIFVIIPDPVPTYAL